MQASSKSLNFVDANNTRPKVSNEVLVVCLCLQVFSSAHIYKCSQRAQKTTARNIHSNAPEQFAHAREYFSSARITNACKVRTCNEQLVRKLRLLKGKHLQATLVQRKLLTGNQ